MNYNYGRRTLRTNTRMDSTSHQQKKVDLMKRKTKGDMIE